MAQNQITGKVIAFSNIETIQSNEPGKQPMEKRKLYLDCTRYDPYTGERGFENTPLLEFGGKSLEKLNALVTQGLKKDDIVTVSFDIQGTKYTNRSTGKQDIFTRVRPYDIELFKKEQPAQAPALQASAPAAQPVQQEENFLPF